MVQGLKVNKIEDERRLKLYQAGRSDREIAAGIYTRCAIGYWRKRRGLPSHNKLNTEEHKSIDGQMVESIRSYAHDGLDDEAIGKLLGLTKSAVLYQRNKHGIASGVVNARNTFITKLMELHKQGKATKEIASELGCSKGCIVYWCKQMFLKPHRMPSNRLLRMVGREDVAMRLYKEMKSDGKIAKAVGVSITTIRKWRKKNDLPMFRIKKTKLVIRRIRKLHRTGMMDDQIGEKLGCHKNTVQYYRYKIGLKANLIKPLVSEADKERIMIAWSTGAGDNRCAKALGMSIGTYYYQKRMLGLKAWLFGRQCKMCGKPIASLKMQHLCDDPQCKKEYEQTKVEKLFLVRNIRANYMVMAFCDPEEAIKIREQMVNEEGEAFTEMAIDGITPQMAEEHMAKKVAAERNNKPSKFEEIRQRVEQRIKLRNWGLDENVRT